MNRPEIGMSGRGRGRGRGRGLQNYLSDGDTPVPGLGRGWLSQSSRVNPQAVTTVESEVPGISRFAGRGYRRMENKPTQVAGVEAESKFQNHPISPDQFDQNERKYNQVPTVQESQRKDGFGFEDNLAGTFNSSTKDQTTLGNSGGFGIRGFSGFSIPNQSTVVATESGYGEFFDEDWNTGTPAAGKFGESTVSVDTRWDQFSARNSQQNYKEEIEKEEAEWTGLVTNSWGNEEGKGGFAAPSYTRGFIKAALEEDEKRKSMEEKSAEGTQTEPGGGTTNEDSGERPSLFAQMLAESKEAEKRKWAALGPIKKNYYEEHTEVAAMKPEEVAKLRSEKNKISVTDMSKDEKPRETPKPVWSFAHAFNNYPDLLEQLERLYKEPSPIQCQLWSVALSGFDAIGIAQTGSGKTLAFLLPAFIHIDGKSVEDRKSPSCLVLTPTRELAQQIEREVRKYHYKGIKSVCVYGGGDRTQQCFEVKEGVDIIIATPGRLNDLTYSGVINLKRVSFLVLDEADRMLDMGFEPQIRKSLIDVRPDRHTIMTSATWPRLVRQIAAKYTVDPFLVYVGSLDLTACHTVEQTVTIVEEESKSEILMTFVKEMKPEDKALIFVGRKNMADHLASELIRKGIECQCMHGDRDQRERERALKELRSGTVRLLVATDVASRGLDITDITHVINYDFPKNMEEYVHRVGRTGRAGKSGQSITLMTRFDSRNARELTRILAEAKQEVPVELIKMAESFEANQERQRLEGPSRGRWGGGGSSSRPPPQRGFRDPFTEEWITSW